MFRPVRNLVSEGEPERASAARPGSSSDGHVRCRESAGEGREGVSCRENTPSLCTSPVGGAAQSVTARRAEDKREGVLVGRARPPSWRPDGGPLNLGSRRAGRLRTRPTASGEESGPTAPGGRRGNPFGGKSGVWETPRSIAFGNRRRTVSITILSNERQISVFGCVQFCTVRESCFVAAGRRNKAAPRAHRGRID